MKRSQYGVVWGGFSRSILGMSSTSKRRSRMCAARCRHHQP